MKFTVAFLAAFVLLLASCKKNDPSPEYVPTSVNFTGNWEIRTAQAGSKPAISYAPGNDSLLIFTKSTYEIRQKGQFIRNGSYTIVEDNSFNSLVVSAGQFTHRIIYDRDTTTRIFLQVGGNRLTFLSGNFALDTGSMTEYEYKPSYPM